MKEEFDFDRITRKKLNKFGVVKVSREQNGEFLKKGKVEGIYWDGYLSLIETKIKTLRKIREVGGDLNCTNARNLENIGELECVGGWLTIKGCTLKLQLELIERVKKGKLKVSHLVYDDYIDKIYDGDKLIYKEFEEIFGESISKLEDEDLKKEFIWILQREYTRIKKIIKEKTEAIKKENKGKKLTKEEKKKVRIQIQEIDKTFRRQKKRIESFGIEL